MKQVIKKDEDKHLSKLKCVFLEQELEIQYRSRVSSSLRAGRSRVTCAIHVNALLPLASLSRARGKTRTYARDKMPRLSKETRSRVVLLKGKGFSAARIKKRLEEDGIFVSRRALFKLFAKYARTGTVADLPHAARPRS